MKRKLIFVLGMIISIVSFGQVENKPIEAEIDEIVVTPPLFTGVESLTHLQYGSEDAVLNNFMRENVVYPQKSQKMLEEGTSVVQFVVTAKGEVTDFEVINSVSPEIDQEVIRVIQSTNGMWKPGLNNGTPATMDKEVSVAFKLNGLGINANSRDFLEIAKMYYDKGNKKFYLKNNLKGALKSYNNAICYMPKDKCLLLTRGMCKYELGDEDGACQDWNRIKTLGGFEGDALLDNLCKYKGYAQMMSMLYDKKAE